MSNKNSEMQNASEVDGEGINFEDVRQDGSSFGES